MANIAKRVHYSGTVQGVGFRATTARLAQAFAVVGYVRNLGNGQVELGVQGETQEVMRFLEATAARLGNYIQSQDVEDLPVTTWTCFEIR